MGLTDPSDRGGGGGGGVCACIQNDVKGKWKEDAVLPARAVG